MSAFSVGRPRRKAGLHQHVYVYKVYIQYMLMYLHSVRELGGEDDMAALALGEESARICILGAGPAGLGLALGIARRGFSGGVVVYDQADAVPETFRGFWGCGSFGASGFWAQGRRP